MTHEHYFDWAATSPEDKEILRESLEIALENFGNPSSVHSAGKGARKILEEARERSARAIGVKPSRIFFTSGGTESDHIPLLSVLNSPMISEGKRGRIILSAIEHPALREQCAELKRLGFEIVSINPDKNGFVSPESVSEKITPDTLFITVMAVNNETGCIQPIYEIADAITKAANEKRKPHFHVDCVQAAGKIQLDLGHKGIDSAALSSHKICGPRGIGILYLAREIRPFLTGGGQENTVRSGTENLFGAVAFSKCLEKYYIDSKSLQTETACDAKNNPDSAKNIGLIDKNKADAKISGHKKAAYERFLLQKKWTANFISRLSELKNCVLVPKIRAEISNSIQEKFSPWVLQAAFKGIPGNVMVRALDSKGFFISTGSACSSKKQSRPILAAMNESRDIQDSAVRFSFGPLTTEQAMNELFEAIKEIYQTFNAE